MAASWLNRVCFMISEKLSTILKTIRQFIQEEVVPLEADFIARPFRELLPRLKEKRDKVKKLGLWAPQLPAKFDGLGLSLAEFARVSEELGRTPMGHYLFNCQAPDAGNLEILMEYGTPEQQERWMRPLVRGDIRSCFSMTEPEFAGSNPVWMGTTAVKEGNSWVIRGHKWFTSSADGAAFAVVMAVTSPDAPKPHRRASMIIVPTDTPGFELVENISVMGHRGADHQSHGEIMYHGAKVPLANLLGPEGGGFEMAQARLGAGRIHHCMRWIGICERAFDIMCRHAVTRQLAPGDPLGSRQLVQSWVAESRAEINGARLMVAHAAWMIEQKGTSEARDEISIIKFTVARTLQRVLDRAIQTLGALGLTDDTPLAFWWAHERAGRIYDGADEVHITSVAKRILRRYGEVK